MPDKYPCRAYGIRGLIPGRVTVSRAPAAPEGALRVGRSGAPYARVRAAPGRVTPAARHRLGPPLGSVSDRLAIRREAG